MQLLNSHLLIYHVLHSCTLVLTETACALNHLGRDFKYCAYQERLSLLPLVLVHDWLPLQALFLGPSISNKQRIQRWITVGVKSIAAGLPGTAIDYESVLVSRVPWWRKGEGRQEREEKYRMKILQIFTSDTEPYIYNYYQNDQGCSF